MRTADEAIGVKESGGISFCAVRAKPEFGSEIKAFGRAFRVKLRYNYDEVSARYENAYHHGTIGV